MQIAATASLSEMTVTLTPSLFRFDEANGTYLIWLTDASLISHDSEAKCLAFRVSANKVQIDKHSNVHVHPHDRNHGSKQHHNTQHASTSMLDGLSAFLDDDQMHYLLNEIDMEIEQQTERETRIHSNYQSANQHHAVLSTMLSEWNVSRNSSVHAPSPSLCGTNSNISCADCRCCQRIQFILKHYTEWLNFKLASYNEYMASSSESASSEYMRSFEWISDFLYELTNYSSYDLCNDFQHILQCHLQTNLKERTQTIEYFEQELGKCHDANCGCFTRHQRDLNVDNVLEEKRRENYFIIDDELSKSKCSPFKIHQEINLQAILDKMHVCLSHNKWRSSNSSKYIHRVQQVGHEEEDDDKQPESESADDVDGAVKLTKHTFGSGINYWHQEHHRYCPPKYDDLRSELLKNSVYSLSPEMYESLKSKAIHFLNTRVGKELVALREHDWMKKFRILVDSQMTVDHVIALYCYCNMPGLQRAYKLHVTQRDGNTQDEMMKRHSEIWHYSRLLIEAVHCFGSPLDRNKNYYHGIDSHIMFDRYSLMIDLPISLTTDLELAYSFSDVSGTMVEFAHGGLSDLQSLCLDLSVFSEFPMEEEYLIFHTFVSIKDICIKRLHHDQWVNILSFWHRLSEGFFFRHLIENDAVSKNDQLCICAMIQNMLLSETSKKYDKRVPRYMQKLFNVLNKPRAIFWIIHSEYDLLVPRLNKYLTSRSSKLLKYLTATDIKTGVKAVKIRRVCTFDW
eukprot:CAMPEP_0197052090 /NCGR_PEP_ID=MMETSP1384-20130603/26616_1 /TAXON_ID=29189 /ORGANISM="Ammonia sp." /LENGTH=738 /DNA_ID=CAMNT_0042484739 /DNA_START=35 /DNA_END=2248 /DNA_ORIENTATION=-